MTEPERSDWHLRRGRFLGCDPDTDDRPQLMPAPEPPIHLQTHAGFHGLGHGDGVSAATPFASARKPRSHPKAMPTTLNRIWIPSPNFSSRLGSSVRMAVLHTAEGALNFQALGHFFADSAVQASSHVGIDDTLGTIGEFVTRGNKAWTQAAFNPVAVSAELCGFASWTREQWLGDHEDMLRNAAMWVAEECNRFGIPIVALTPTQAQGTGRGVCQHSDLGTAGGGHHDCGPGFPMDVVIDWAKNGFPVPPVASEVTQMFYLAERPNSPVALPRKVGDATRRVRLFCNEAQVDVTVDFATSGVTNQTLTTSYDLGPAGVDIPDSVSALVLRRGVEPADGYPLVSVEILT